MGRERGAGQEEATRLLSSMADPDAEFAKALGDMRKVVVSHRPLEFTWRNSEQLPGSLADGAAALKADPGLIKSCVEEGLRFESSNQLGNRRLSADLEIGGERLKAGTYIHIGIGAANRDPAQFPEPDRFDVAREPNRHFAFGSGVHMCLGAVLARLEGTIAIGRLVARLDGLHCTGPYERGGRARFRGFSRYPISWSGAWA